MGRGGGTGASFAQGGKSEGLKLTAGMRSEKMFAFTVELRFPYAPSAPPAPSAPSVAPSGASGASAPSDAQGKDASASTSRILLHRVPGARTAHALFVAELRARALKQAGVEPAKAVDATAPAAGKGKGKKAGKEMDTQAADEAEVFKAGWPRSALLSAGLAAHAASGSSDAASLPADALVLLRVHAQRLRNESSARFARWWAAQVRRGAVDADNVASFETQQAARAAAEEEAQMREEEERQAAMQQAAMRPPPGGYAGPPPGYASSSYYTGPPPPHAPPPQAFPAPAPAAQHALARLTSGALLGSLGAKLRGPNVAVAGAAPSAASAPQAPGPSAPAPPASPAPPKPAPPAPAARHFVSLRPSLGLEATLAALPAGYAIVEYPQLELWPQGEVEEAEREGRIEVLELEVEEKGEGKRARDGEEEEEEEEGSKRARVEGDEEEAADAPMTDVSPPPQPAQLAAPALRAPAPAPAPAPSGLISLAAYDSDSDSSSDGDSSTSPAAAPAPAARQLSPEQLRSRQLARSELLSAAPHPSSSSSEPEDEEGEGEEEARGSVADIARMLGMAPAVVVAKEEVKPKTALKKLPMPMREEEEEVDWGED